MPAMRLNRKKNGCPSHNTPDVWNPSGYNAEIWEALLVHNFSKFLCSITQNENLSMILDEWSQNLL